MYDYAKKSYTHGLPSGDQKVSTQGKLQAEAALEGIESNPVLVDYCFFGPPNNLHIGWLKLIELHGYSHATNQLAGLTIAKGTPVYLKDMVVVVPASMMASIEIGSLDQWGTPATAGYTPERPLKRTHPYSVDVLGYTSNSGIHPRTSTEYGCVLFTG